MKLNWDIKGIKELTHVDKKYGAKLIMRESEGILVSLFNSGEVQIDRSKAKKVLVCEPKLLKKGLFAFMSENEEPLSQPAGELNIPLVFEFSKRDSDTFYLMYSVLKDNGFEMLFE
ncbi:MAG: hypothetical protein IJW43_01640 [Clostridia bacterium]|nr:hypothetical protein [Clostridia bacterium]